MTTLPSTHHPAAFRRSCRIYAVVGALLFGGTLATYCVATIPALDVGKHGFDRWDCAVGLLIASAKASAVALVFMHLNHEKKLIYFIVLLGCFHAAALAILLRLADADLVHNPFFDEGSFSQTEGIGKQGPANGRQKAGF